MSYCAVHRIEYDLGTMCSECWREQILADQKTLLDSQIEYQEESLREAERLNAGLIKATKNAEYKRFNPGKYKCDSCKYNTLLWGATRCPICQSDIPSSYWTKVYEVERLEKESRAAAYKKIEENKKRACEIAVTIVKLGIQHTDMLWYKAFEETSRKRESQSFISRLFFPEPVPNKMYLPKFEITEADASYGRWTKQPTLILGVVTLDTKARIGFKYYRFDTPHEYISVFKYLKTLEAWNSPTVSSCISEYNIFLNQDWNFQEIKYPKRITMQQDNSESLQEILKCAVLGNPNSQYELGLMYDEGTGVNQDYIEALKWYRKAADQGEDRAQRKIGRMYSNGEGVELDYVEALKWYRLAADHGNVKAKNDIGIVYRNGEGVVKDYAEAMKWFKIAANEGEAHALWYIGNMIYYGEGVKKDYTEAMKWFLMAVNHGYMHANNDIGLMYQYGEGVVKDYAEAMKWFRIAAEQGDNISQFNLGYMYFSGLGVSKDNSQALKWFRMASDQANVEAQFYIDLISGKFDK